MKELEEVHCEVRRVVDLQISVSDRLNNVEDIGNSPSIHYHAYDSSDNHLGGFLNNATYAWLSYGPHLVVFNVKTGESKSSWTFREKIACVSQFPSQPGELPLLLVGLDNNASKIKDSVGLLCIFDCTASRVLRAIRMPVGVQQVCVISGGAEWEEFSDKRPDNLLSEMGGIACIVLRNLHHIMINLQRSEWDGCTNSFAIMDEASPAELDFSVTPHSVSKIQLNESKHTAYKLFNSRIEKSIGFDREKFELSGFCTNKLIHTIISSSKIGCLISGCLGRVIIWENDGSIGWISPPIDENMIISHLALLEPADDPRPFYYLWVVYQEESLKTPPILKMYALLFERKYCDKGTNLYFNLEAKPSLTFELELDEGDKVISLSTIETENNPDQTDVVTKRGQESLLLITTSDRTLLFDLNQWYKEQMPQTLCECQNPNSILASYRTESNTQSKVDNQIISATYIPSTLREYPNYCSSSPEELFYPNALSLEWVQLGLTKLTVWLARGVQANLLHEIAIAGPIILVQPSEIFHKCLSVGLVPFNSEFSFVSDQNTQREMLLSLCLEQRWSTFLVKCAKEWSDGSASYLYPTFLKWGVQRASSIKVTADRLCVPLFDQSGNSIGEAEVKTLRFCSQQLECLSNVVAKIPLETDELIKQQRALKHVSMYFQVLLWFYDVGLLPETQELDEANLPISFALKIPYPLEKLIALYNEKRQLITKNANNQGTIEEGLFIDELIMRECPTLKEQWEREGADINASGYYPPPSLQSLLRSYLTDCHQTELNEIAYKHQITIYLLMDLAMLLQGSYPGVDQLIKYPSAFKMSPSLIKLTQAFWLLDHEDYQGFLDMMTGQLVSDSDTKDWHHKLVLKTLVRNDQRKLALTYLRVRKPPLSSIEDHETVISLSVEHGLVQSAFHHRPPCHYAQLLTCFFQACKAYGKLDEILHLALDTEEEEVFIKFLQETNYDDIRVLYYLQRCRYTEASNGSSFNQHKSTTLKNIQPASFTMLDAYNTTLPNITKQFTINMTRLNCDVDLESKYPRPMSHYKSHNASLNIHEVVIRKAKETYLKTEKCQVPFISAPCTALKSNETSTHMNCVVFPVLAKKNHNKRTLDHIYENEDNAHNTIQEIKRRKISDETNALNESVASKTPINVTLDTPLIKRKNVIDNKNSLLETPQSILKIRQLIRDSASPNSCASHTNESVESLAYEKEKKVNRQIRFNINQSNNSSVQETGDNKDEDDEEDDNKMNTTRENEDLYYSPNISGIPQNESNVLSDSSSSITKNIYRPRPRPGLRRSCLQSSRDSLLERSKNSPKLSSTLLHDSSTPSQCHNELSNSAEINTETPVMCSRPIPRPRSSLLSTTFYASSILTDDSSFEMNSPSRRNKELNVPSLCKPVTMNSRLDITIESQIKKNTDIENTYVNKEDIQIKNNDIEEKLPLIDNTCTDIENAIQTCYTTKEHDEEEIKAQSGYKDGNSIKDKSYMQNTCELTSDYVYKNNNMEETALSDESNEELICIESDDGNDDDDFTSFSNSVENKHNTSAPSSDKWTLKVHNNNFHENAKHMDTDFDITDDESNDAQEINFACEKNQEINKDNREDDLKSESAPVCTSNIYDNRNITDDESDNSVENKDSKLKIRDNDSRKESITTYTEVQHSTITTQHFYEEHDKSIAYPDVCKDNSEQLANNSTHNLSKNTHLKNKIKGKKLKKEMSKELDTTEVKHETDSHKGFIETKEEVPIRRTSLRKASSIAKDIITSHASDSLSQNVIPDRIERSRRANSLAQDIPTALTKGTDKNLVDVALPASQSLMDSSSTKKTQAQHVFVTKEDNLNKNNDQDIESNEVTIQLRRSTRRAASVQKEMYSTSKPLTKQSRTASASSLLSINDNVKDTSKKKSTRGRRALSVMKEIDETVTHDVTENSAFQTPPKANAERTDVRQTRKRGNSEPKELVSNTVRTSRSSSMVKESVPEKIPSNTRESKTRRNSMIKITENVVNGPAANTRSRRSSIQSMPEELEEVLSIPSEERTSIPKGKKVTQSTVRERRATSLDPVQMDLKRSTRNLRTRRIVEEPIAEELSESQDTDQQTSETVRQLPTRRKRILSDSNLKSAGIKEAKTENTKKKQISDMNDESNDQFSFSQPERTNDFPLDKKDLGEVPNYVFSPPQTRSKYGSNQHQK